MKKLAVVAVVLASAGCSRDLELPAVSAFAVSASPTTVAPRQTSTVTASGGAGAASSLSFGFAPGGKLSGDDAAVVANGDGTATYTAGRNGSTQDTVVVRDASGAEKSVIITVGARVSIAPLVGGTAPGGSLVFVASGGKSPYTFSVSPLGTGASIAVDPLDATKGLYVAGTTGDIEETVTVTDATGDAAASASAVVRVGTQLGLYRPSTGPVAPNEAVTVVAFGGRSPYEFGPVCAAPPPQPTGCFASADEPVFSVGSDWSSGLVATATVTDANGQTASLGIEVGAPLSARLGTPLVRPGVANRIVASGGKAPYAFRFATHGNHSGGEVDAVSGAYLPGRSPGALDRLEVEDATGTVVALTDVRAVGPLEITTGRDGDRCVAGDYDGDGTEDLAFLFRGMSLLEVNRVAFDPLYRTYYVGTGFMFPSVFSEDLDLDGRAELHFAGWRSGGPTYTSAGVRSDLGYWVLDPDMTGLFGNPDAMTFTPFTFGLGTMYEEIVAGAHYTYFLSDQARECTDALVVVRWVDGVPASIFCSPPIANFSGLGQATGLVAGDFTGDGAADFAWLAASSDPFYANTWNTPGPIYFRYMNAGTFADGGSLALPSLPEPTTYEGQGNGEQSRIVRVPTRPAPFPAQEGLLVRLRKANGDGVLAFATGNGLGQLAWTFTDFNPFAPGGSVASIALYTPRPGGWPLAVAFAGTSGAIAVFDPWAADPSLTMGTGEAVFPVSYGCSVDADADGFPDFALGGATSELAAVAWGDGWGGFGTRPRLATGGWGGVGGDLDGDGLVDVATSDGAALTALFGDAGQLGWSEEPITTLPASTAAIAHFVDQGNGTKGANAPRDSILFQGLDAEYYLVRTTASGAFEAPIPLVASSGLQAGVPRVTHRVLQPADLGGLPGSDGTGPDLIAARDDNYGHGWIHVLLRPDPDVSVEEHMSPVVGDYRQAAPPGGIVKTHQCAYAPVRDGAGNHAVASLCAYETVAGEDAAEWRVRGWPISWQPGWYDQPWTDAGTYVGSHAGAAGSETAVAALGEQGGKAWFLVATDRLLLVAVDPGASALDPSGWTATATALTATRRATPFLAQWADLDADGDLDAVVGGEGETVVLRNVGTSTAPSFTWWYDVPAAGLPVAVGPLGFADAGATLPAKPSAVLAGMRGGWFQLVAPDAAGILR